MKKVLHLASSSRGGGAETVRLTVKALAGHFEQTVILAPDGGHVTPELIRESGGRCELFALHSGFSIREFLRLRAFLKRERFDLIHLYGARAAFWGRMGMLGRLPRPRVVYGVYGLAIAHRRGLRRAMTSWLERRLESVTDATVCDTQACEREMRQLRLASNVHLIPNGIDPQRLLPRPDRASARAQLNLSPDDFVLLFTGRLDQPRDFRTLLSALASLVSTHPRARLLLAGSGPYRPDIEERIRVLKLENSVRLLGLVTDVKNLYAAADVFTLITQGWEGLPMALLESMAAGLPAVASSVGGIPEAMEENVTGLITPPGEVQAVTAAFRWMADHPDERMQMGSAASRRFVQHYHFQQMGEKVASLYSGLLKHE